MSAEANTSKGPQTPSEDEVGRKWDRCFSDLILKTGAGASIGIIFSLTLFKSKTNSQLALAGKLWPIALGTGIGIGYGSSNCQHDFRRVPTVHMRPIKETSRPPTETGSKSATKTPASSEVPAATESKNSSPDTSSSKQNPPQNE